MGTTLFSCTDKNGKKQKIDAVEVVEGSITNENITVGEAPIIKDTLKPKLKIYEEKFIKPKCNNEKIEVVQENNINISSGMVIPELIKDSIITK